MKEYPDDIPWREVFKEAIPFLLILVVYFAVMAAVKAQTIAWLISAELRVKSDELRTSSTLNSQLSTLNFSKGGAK